MKPLQTQLNQIYIWIQLLNDDMKHKVLFSLFATLTLVSIANAQIDSSKVQLSHEFGAFAGGILASSITGQFDRTASRPIGLSYKNVNGKWATRFAYIYQFNRSTFPTKIDAPLVLPNGDIQTISNEGQSRQHIFRLGREYRIPLKYNIQLVLGADLQCRNVLHYNQFNSSIMKIDTILNPGTSVQQTKYTEINNSTLEWNELSAWQYGIGLSGGFLIPVGKRWLINSNLRLDSFYGFYNNAVYKDAGNTISKTRSSFLNVDTSWFVSELAVFYRF